MNITIIKQTVNDRTFQPEILMKVEMSIEWIQDQKALLSQAEFEQLIGRKFIEAVERAKSNQETLKS
jgi:hypothetical protein